MKDIVKGILTVIGVLGVAALILGLPVMWLWNWLMPIIFNLPTITLWQAIGLNLLTSILFKSYNTKK